MPSSSQASPSRHSTSIRVLALSSGNALSLVAGMIAAMVAARLLTKGDYATIRQTFLVYDFMAPLLLLGIPNSLYYLLPRAAEGSRRSTITDAVAVLLVSGGVFGAFLALGGAALLARNFDNQALAETLPWLAVYAVAMMPVGAIGAVLVLTDRVVALTVYNVAVSIGIAGATIAAMAITHSYAWPIAARIAVAVIALPIGLWLMLTGSDERIRMPAPANMAAIVRYSAPLGLAFMIGAVSLQIHALIVSLLCTPEQFAVYVNGAMEIPLINAFVGAITTIALADMAARVAQGRHLEALELFKSATTSAAFIVFPATIYFALAAYPFIIFLFSDKYAESTVPFLIYLLAAPARVAVYGSALMALGMTRQVLIRTLIDLALMTAISVAGVHFLGPNGAAWALVLSLYGFTVPYCIYYIGKGYGVPWTMVMPWRSLAGAVAAAAACAPIPALSIYLLDKQPAFVQLAVSASLYGALYLAIMLRLRIVSLPTFIAKRFTPHD